MPPVSLILAANLPPVSTTLAKLVAKFATGVFDTGGASLLANISANFRKKSETVLMGYSGAGGKLIHEKTRSKKSRDTVPLKLRKCATKGKPRVFERNYPALYLEEY